MVLASLVLLHCCDPAPTYSGRDRQLDVRIPRVEADALIDGDLSDSVWAHAARLTGFSQYAPNDGVPAADSTAVLVCYSPTAIYFGIRAFERHGRPTTIRARLTGFSQYAPNDGVPAADSTEVLVWYSPTAIYFGIRAFERHGRPTMTLANRDQIFGDDNVQILLGTFPDGKQALMFAVNPVGVQGDGSLVEGANVTASGFIGGAGGGRGAPRPGPRLRVSIARARHRLGIRSRGAHPVQEPPLSAAPAAGLEAEHRARGPALGRRGFLVPGETRERAGHLA